MEPGRAAYRVTSADLLIGVAANQGQCRGRRVARAATDRLRALATCLVAPIGRRGAILILVGTIYICAGLRLLGPQHTGYLASHRFLFQLAPVETWGAVFVGVGVLALVASRYPPERERWGFYTMAGLAGLWSISGPLSRMSNATALLIICGCAFAALAIRSHDHRLRGVGVVGALLSVVGSVWSVASTGGIAPWAWPETVVWAAAAGILIIVAGWVDPHPDG